MEYEYFDIFTLILYVCVAYFCYFQFRAASMCCHGVNNKNNCTPYYNIFIVLSLFAALRSIENGIGGSDARPYESIFLNALKSVEQFEHTDVLFGWFTICIRYFTDNPIIYRFICYSIIVLGYIYFFKAFCIRGISCIPFIVLMIPYLKSFNTMRTSLAIAVILFGLVLLKEKRTFWAVLVILASVFVHRMSVLYILFLPFYAIFKKFKYESSVKLIVVMAALSVIGYLLARKVQIYVLAAGMLSGHDDHYLSANLKGSILDIAVTLIPLLLIAMMWLINNKKLPNSRNVKFLELMVSFDIIITPVAYVLGMWRANEYFYMGRLMFWAYLIPVYCSIYEVRSRKLVKACFIAMFTAWLVYRICREWEPCSLMPYKLFFQ
ncbi:EpsG family protein [Muribaculum caecicola]|uniref:EpsG family protein n=2 Tax=Muribaculum TaxID=1918540 RepID=A0AC61S763_9BACT|nr:EpsG family protein [Muribaculum caecicola]THG54328.1 EpsG family protein [Muribaculum caecicola]